MSEILKTFISTAERQLLWVLVQYDTANSVHDVIAQPGPTSLEKTQKIVNQLDFIFEIRGALQAMPPQGGKITLSELGRAYLSTLLDSVHHELLSPELRATFFRDKESMQMKFGDIKSAFLLPAAPAGKVS